MMRSIDSSPVAFACKNSTRMSPSPIPLNICQLGRCREPMFNPCRRIGPPTITKARAEIARNRSRRKRFLVFGSPTGLALVMLGVVAIGP